MNWKESPTKPGQLYFIYDPIHMYIDYHPMGYYEEPTWCLTSQTLGLDKVSLKTTDLAEARKIAEKIVFEKTMILKGELETLLQKLETQNV